MMTGGFVVDDAGYRYIHFIDYRLMIKFRYSFEYSELSNVYSYLRFDLIVPTSVDSANAKNSKTCLNVISSQN